jgi:hypothetical protein
MTAEANPHARYAESLASNRVAVLEGIESLLREESDAAAVLGDFDAAYALKILALCVETTVEGLAL